MYDQIHGVLLFDEDATQREPLRDELTRSGYQVTAIGHVADVLREVRTQRNIYDFAVFDLDFRGIAAGTGELEVARITDGLRLCQSVSSIDPSLPIILYHDTSRSDPSHIAGHRQLEEPEAIANGACRLVQQRGVPNVLAGLVKQLRELDEIGNELKRLQEARASMGHLVAGLGAGFQVVDGRGRVWFTDDEFRRVVGTSGMPDRICYCQSHGYCRRHGMCHNCVVRKVMAEGLPDYEIFYSPTYPQGPGTAPVFQYLSVRATPIFAKNDSVPGTNSDGSDRLRNRAIAAIEAVSSVPSRFIAHLPLNVHLEMLAKGLQDMGFRRVSVFRCRSNAANSPLGELEGILACSIGADQVSDTVPLAHVYISIRSTPPHNPGPTTAVQVCPDANGTCLVINDAVRKELGIISAHPPLSVALVGPEGNCIGWVLLDNAGPDWELSEHKPVIQSDLVPLPCHGCIPPKPVDLIAEIGRVLHSKPRGSQIGLSGSNADTVKEEQRYERVCLRVAGATHADPAATIGLILEAVKEEMSGIEMAHVRRVDGDLALSVKHVGAYGGIADDQLDIRTSKRLTAQVARTGLGIIISDIEAQYGEYPPGLEEFTPDARSLLLSYKSHAVLPIRTEIGTVGTLSCQAKKAGFFTASRERFLRAICALLSRALEDFSRDQVQKTADELPRSAAMMVAHNLAQPLAIIQKSAELIRQDLPKNPDSVGQWVGQIERQCKRLVAMRRSLIAVAHSGTASLQVEDIQTRDLLSVMVEEWTEGRGIQTKVEIDPGLETCRVPRAILETCLGVMIPNAVDAMDAMSDLSRRLTVRVRSLGAAGNSFDVVDTGPGVPDEVAPYLFRPLKSAKSLGMGIGLAVAQKLARSVQGDITWSRANGETVFSLRFKR